MSAQRNYSSQSDFPSIKRPSRSCPTSADPSGKAREKDDMVGLNNKFVQLIEKVKHLEDENKKLDTKLKILKAQEEYEGKIDDMVKQLGQEMEEQIDTLIHDQDRLRAELLRNQDEVEDTKREYEDEFQKRAELENEFIVFKKDVDAGHLEAVDLVLELEDLMGKLDFIRLGYDEEIKELESQVQNETVLLHDDSQRSLDMDEIVESVKNQYATMATRGRVEAEQWNQSKMDAMVLNAGQHEQEVRDLKRDISDNVRHLQRLKADLDALRRKEESLKKELDTTREEGESNLEKGRGAVAQLEDALRRTKQDLTGQIREYQQLMNLKLALDIEIATYRKLLEGEEERMNNLMCHPDVHPPEKLQTLERAVTMVTTIIPTCAIIPRANPTSRKRMLI